MPEREIFSWGKGPKVAFPPSNLEYEVARLQLNANYPCKYLATPHQPAWLSLQILSRQAAAGGMIAPKNGLDL